ncbi:hypothetical protein ACFSKI_16315 [Pseudogracilibacillus auburnensis]|uniref:Ferric reductase like protein n=1 Tax=Pseudogracilibacillus auburnensis TaxID=1494959 RepID=A0A2V3W8F6_9BACI|nr:hypothetical protein [Pseudogracilibacillus auburnensis]PXW89468.1 hypothetical protein DFR56_102245 [Pseudogracilibacillus auburnensis]
MSKWFFINLAVFIFALWKMSTGHLGVHILFGGFGLLFILYNWTRHAVFSTIRSNISRKRKIKYAKLSKKVLPIHKWTGTTALILILFHIFFVIHYFGFQVTNVKMVSGLLAVITLSLVVITGWMRFIKTTYKRRMIHLTLGFCLFTFVLLHLIF